MQNPLKIQLFGPMRVWVDGGSMGTVRSRKAHWLLALLVLRSQRTTTREWLANALWPDTDRSVALANLRTVLSELRQAMGDQGWRLLSPERSLLSLDLSGAEVDVLQFDQAATGNNPEDAIATYTAPLLDGCEEEWVHQERRERANACAIAFEKLLESADPARAIELSRKWVALEPSRDAPRRCLMQVLADAGDSNEALHVYREYAFFLQAESGGVPDEATTRFYLDIRKGTRRPSTDSQPQTPGNLPHAFTSLIGLEDERIEASERVRQNRLVTITGFGGIGKTRLAREIAANLAREFPGGVWFIALDTLNDPHLIEHHVASALGVAEKSGQPTLKSLATRLKSARTLLILDNCEHLLSGSGELARNLLQECGSLHILATSREPLSITGEKLWRALPLSFPDPAHLPGHPATLVRVSGGFESVQLFVERAQAIDDHFELRPDNAQRVAEICFYLEGIPLAIELATACLRTLSIHQIADRVREPISLLTQRSRSASPRQQTLSAAIEWSYGTLDDGEQTLLSQVAEFLGGWTVDAVEAICGDGAMSALSGLVDKSLVVFDPQGRYRLLETVRQYALAKQGTGDSLSRTRFVSYYSQLLKRWGQEARGDQQAEKRLGSEEGNIRQALSWVFTDRELNELGLQIAADWADYWFAIGRFSEGLRHLRAMLELDSGENVQLRAYALSQAAALASATAQYRVALALLTEALETYRELEDQHGVARTSRYLGDAHDGLGQGSKALELYEEAFRISQVAGLERDAAVASVLVGSIRSGLGLVETASEWIRSGHDYFLKTQEQAGISWSLNRLGNIFLDNGPEREAIEIFEQALRIDLETSSFLGGYTLNNIATAHNAIGECDKARDYILHGLEIADNHEDSRCKAGLFRTLSDVECTAGNYKLAIEAAHKCFRVMNPDDATLDTINCLGSLSIALNGLGQPFESAVMISAAFAGLKAWSINVPKTDLNRLNRAQDKVRQNLSTADFDEATRIGSNLDLEATLARSFACLQPGKASATPL